MANNVVVVHGEGKQAGKARQKWASPDYTFRGTMKEALVFFRGKYPTKHIQMKWYKKKRVKGNWT